MNTKKNQRFQETEKLIQQTLLELAKEKDIRQVTVRAICEKAQINRSSFYLHYLDIHDLVDKMGKEMMQDIREMLHTEQNAISFMLTESSLTDMITYVEKHQLFFDIYLNHYTSEANETFSLLWEHHGKSYLQEHFTNIDESEMWYHFSFYKAGFLSVLSQWVKNGCVEEPEKIAKLIIRSIPKYNF